MLFLKTSCTSNPASVTAPSKLIHGPGLLVQSKVDTVACRFMGSERLVVTWFSACTAGATTKLIMPTTTIAACLFRSLKFMLDAPSVVDRMVRNCNSPIFRAENPNSNRT